MSLPSTYSEPFFLQTKDEDQLAKLAREYPWCGAIHFYLLHNYKKNNSAQFEKQGEKTALFFENANRLNWQLHSLLAQTEKQKEIIKEEIYSEKILEENIIAELPEIKNIESEKNIADDIITFEPLHTTDYFASQGIKISAEFIANDKLGSQMKSFTEWLKSMKKIHKENLPVADEQTDKKIQHIAENSNAAAEVVTESMAEVLINQNKLEKAIEVYQKLSLIYPLKSDYFAAKINSIKTS